MNTSLQHVATKTLPALFSERVTYNAAKNLFLSMGYANFLLAGHIGADRRFFEKDFKDGRHWYYLRVEFPAELTKEIEPLLQ